MVIRFFPKYSPYQIDIYSPENKNTANYCGVYIAMVAPAGFEPATF